MIQLVACQGFFSISVFAAKALYFYKVSLAGPSRNLTGDGVIQSPIVLSAITIGCHVLQHLLSDVTLHPGSLGDGFSVFFYRGKKKTISR